MPIITSVSSPALSAGPSAPAAASGSGNVDKDQFLNLLVNQLKNQNPLEPVTNEQFIGQLAQFQSLEAQQEMNSNLNTLIDLQAVTSTISHLTQASSLMGKKIEYTDVETQEKATGIVTSVGLENGSVVAKIGDKSIPILLITSVQPEK
ncbi:MAG: flagellar hook assembly protein FlgD [Planctomycetota bacterium]